MHTSASILLHGDPDSEFQLEFELHRHILPLLYQILIDIRWAWHGKDMIYDISNKWFGFVCCRPCELKFTVVVGIPTPMANFHVVI